MRPEPGTNPEWDARVLSWQQKRDDITQRFRWRRHHNQRQATRYGQANTAYGQASATHHANLNHSGMT